MKKTLTLILTLCVLSVFTTASFAAGTDLNGAYQQYMSSYKKYVEAINANAPQEQLDALCEEYKTSIENYKKLGGKTEALPEAAKVQSGNNKAAVSDESEKASGEAASSAASVIKSRGQAKYDAIIADLEKKISSKSKSGIDVNELKIQLARHYSNLREDYKKAQQLASEVAASSKNPELVKKAQELVQDFKMREKKTAVIKAMNAKKDAAKVLYDKYKAIKWSSPLAKGKALASYYVGLFKYKKSVSDFHSFKKEYEKLTQNFAVTDATFDNITDSEPVAGNDVTLLINGKCAFAKRYEIAKEAKSYIYVEYLSYKNDKTGNTLADILIAKAKEGVDVRVIVDYWTTFSYKKDIIFKLRAGGVKVALFNNPFRAPLRVNNRNHQKLFIIDDTCAITGGMNVGDDYAMGSITVEGWRDTDIYLEGPVVMEMKQLFLNNWAEGDNQDFLVRSDEAQQSRDEAEFLSKDFKVDESTMYKPSTNPKLIKEVLREYYAVMPTVKNTDLRFISHYPMNKDDHVLEAMVWYINKAKTEVILETPYFLPAKKLEAALIAASKRGVKVSVITNSMYSNDMGKYIVYASHYFFQTLIENNIKIYEWYGSQTLHAKCNYFDGVAVTIGSYNLNSRSHGLDAEELILIENKEFAKIMHDVFMEDLKYCREVTLEEAKEWRTKFSEKAKMNIFHLVDGIF